MSERPIISGNTGSEVLDKSAPSGENARPRFDGGLQEIMAT